MGSSMEVVMKRHLSLSATERCALAHLRDHAAKAYLRERAAALLKIADGTSAAAVARTGLLKPRHPDTVCAWVDRFLADGLAGLTIRPGRGRRPAFSPSARRPGRRPRRGARSARAGSAPVRP
jgi:hypothetical protein